MTKTILPGSRRGRITAPPSKSDAHRALICAALCQNLTTLSLGTLNADIEATLRCLSALGVGIERGVGTITVIPQTSRPLSPLLDCGESGTTLRLLLPMATLLADNPRFIGAGRLPQRPNGALLDAMSQNGCVSDSDYLPLALSGKLRPGSYSLPGNVSSQFVSGLLIALAALPGMSEILLTSPLESAAYVDMTIRTLSRFGVEVQRITSSERLTTGFQLSTVNCQLKTPSVYGVEGDWSGAAFFIAMDALGGNIAVEGLDETSAQPDMAIMRLAKALPDSLDVSAFPDLFPVLSILSCGKIGVTKLCGARRLRLKESDRIAATAKLITGLCGVCEAFEDALVIHGSGHLRGGAAFSENDHRIAMSAAVAATICQTPVTLEGAEAVEKSYPRFWNDFEQLEIIKGE